MTITTNQTQPTSTNLNNIPVGTVFQGEIQTAKGNWISGTFFKAHGRILLNKKDGTNSVPYQEREVVVVKLDGGGMSGFANLFLWCRDVRGYRPAQEVELKLTF